MPGMQEKKRKLEIVTIPVSQTVRNATQIFFKMHPKGIAHRGTFDGGYKQQFYGKVMEGASQEWLFGRFRGFPGGNRQDGGLDIPFKGMGIDVKGLIRTVDVRDGFDAVVPNSQLQNSPKTDIYLFPSYNEKRDVVEIIGWRYKCEIDKVGEFSKAGETKTRADSSTFDNETDSWYISVNHLYPPKWLKQLGEQQLHDGIENRKKYYDNLKLQS